MKYETVQKLNDEAFKRSTGVQRQTFEKMVKVVEAGFVIQQQATEPQIEQGHEIQYLWVLAQKV